MTTVLIVQRASIDRFATELLLESMGWAVTSVSSVAMATKYLDRHFDFLITQTFVDDGSCADVVGLFNKPLSRTFIMAAETFRREDKLACWNTGVDAVFDFGRDAGRFGSVLMAWDCKRFENGL